MLGGKKPREIVNFQINKMSYFEVWWKSNIYMDNEKKKSENFLIFV